MLESAVHIYFPVRWSIRQPQAAHHTTFLVWRIYRDLYILHNNVADVKLINSYINALTCRQEDIQPPNQVE